MPAAPCGARPGGCVEPGRSGLVVVGRALPGQQPGAAAPGHQGFGRARPGRLAGLGRRSTGRRTTGRGVGRRPTSTSQPARSAAGSRPRASSLFPVVQWAERGGYEAGGHGNSVPRFHLIWGSGPGVLTPFVRRVTEHVRSGRVQVRYRHRVTELTDRRRGRHRSQRGDPGADRRRPRRAVLPDRGRRLHPGQLGGDRDLRRDRRQSRSGPAELAGRTGAGARRDALRGAGFRRRTDAGGRRPGRRPGDQPGPDVALPGGRDQPLPGLVRARHPHSVRAVPAMAGRVRPPAAGAAVPRLRLARRPAAHPGDRPDAFLVAARQEDHRARVRAVRVRSRTRTSPRSRSSCC